jgi:hypothetical protein
MKYLISFLAVLFLVGYAYGQDDIFGNNYGFLSPMKHNAYGPGIHSDATGRPFKFKTFDGQDVGIFDVKPNAYGQGIGMDEFGRSVRPIPLNKFGH